MKRLVMLVAGTVVALAACSSGGSGGTSSPSSPPPTGPPLYTDPNYGYTLTYAAPFRFGSGIGIQELGSANNPAAGSAMFYDSSVKEKTSAGGMYPVSVTISVFPLRVPVTPDNWNEAKTQVEQNVLPQLQAPNTRFSPLEETTLAGRPALTTTTKQDAAGTPVTITLTYVFDGTNEYQVATEVTDSASKELSPTLDKMVASLTLPGTWPSGAPSDTASTSAPASSTSASSATSTP